MHDKTNNVWAQIEPALLEDIIQYKKGLLSGAEANRIEKSLAEVDPDMIDEISLTDLENLALINKNFQNQIGSSTGGSKLRWIPMAATVLVVGGILSLLYIKMNQGTEDPLTAQHESTTTAEEASTIPEAIENEESPIANSIQDSGLKAEDTFEELEESFPVNEDKQRELNGKMSTNPTNPHTEKISPIKDTIQLESEEALTDETKAMEMAMDESQPSEYKKKDIANISKPVFAIFEKYNDASSRASNAPKRSRAFATMSKSGSADSRYTFRRKASSQFPEGDKALTSWLTSNLSNLIKDNNQTITIRFTVTKKAKVTDISVVGLDEESNTKAKSVLKKMPDWLKPDSGFEPLDIHYAIQGSITE